jgi:hypothetical protein
MQQLPTLRLAPFLHPRQARPRHRQPNAKSHPNEHALGLDPP